MTSEGLRIELLESAGGTFFDSGSAELNKSGTGVADAAGGGTRKNSQSHFGGRTH